MPLNFSRKYNSFKPEDLIFPPSNKDFSLLKIQDYIDNYKEEKVREIVDFFMEIFQSPEKLDKYWVGEETGFQDLIKIAEKIFEKDDTAKIFRDSVIQIIHHSQLPLDDEVFVYICAVFNKYCKSSGSSSLFHPYLFDLFYEYHRKCSKIAWFYLSDFYRNRNIQEYASSIISENIIACIQNDNFKELLLILVGDYEKIITEEDWVKIYSELGDGLIRYIIEKFQDNDFMKNYEEYIDYCKFEVLIDVLQYLIKPYIMELMEKGSENELDLINHLCGQYYSFNEEDLR